MKKRRFADGGETDPDVEMANASDDPIASMNKSKGWTGTAAKPKVVTKEELAKSGLSLRDYMNKQQGLKPRGEATPSSATPAPSKASAATPMSTDPSQRSKPKYQSLQDRAEEYASKRKESGVGMYGGRNSAKDTRTPKRARNLTDMIGLSSQYAKGGSVSSRADGIAQRGKTRGKMC